MPATYAPVDEPRHDPWLTHLLDRDPKVLHTADFACA
jgi:hypothetical protein